MTANRWIPQPLIGFICFGCGRSAPAPEDTCSGAAPLYPLIDGEPVAVYPCGRRSGRPPHIPMGQWDEMLKTLTGGAAETAAGAVR